MLAWARLLVLFLLSLRRAQFGVATNFWPIGDPFNPDPHAACLHRDLTDRDMVVAHPSLPCGSRVFLYSARTGRSAVASIGDRGPRHALVDLAPAVTRRLHANGEEPVLLIPMTPRKGRR